MIKLETLKQRLQSLVGDSNGSLAGKYTDAINSAARETYPILHRRVDNTELITGNILPPFIWTSTTALSVYSATNAALEKTTTAGLFRNGDSSAKVTVNAAEGYLSINSDTYGRLLDLKGQTITGKVWAEPQNANDAFLTIAYEDADASETTSSSTTTCPASVMTLLSKGSLAIPSATTKIGFRMRVHSQDAYAYFDPPRVTGSAVYEYMLPDDFQSGDVKQVWIQTTGSSDDICDDLHPEYGEEVFGWGIVDDGTYKYLRMPYLSSKKRLRLVGYSTLEDDLSASTDTMTIDDRYIPVLLNYAAFSLYEKEKGIVSSDSRDRYTQEMTYWLNKYEMLIRKNRMSRIPGQIHWS